MMRRRLGPWGIAITLSACTPSSSSAPPPSRAEHVTVTPPAGPSPALSVLPSPTPPRELSRWVPARGFDDLGEGRRGAVVGGRRIVLRDGKASILDPNPVAGLGRARRLPGSLGGGFLFIAGPTVYFGTTFEGPLRLIASDAEDQGLGVGHDCVLVRGKSGAPVVYELSTGRTIPAPVPNADQLFGAPSGEVAARTSSGELFFSGARGQPFTKVRGATGIDHLAYDGTSIVARSGRGEESVGRDGQLSPRPPQPGMVTTDNLLALADTWPDFSKPLPAEPDVERMLSPLSVAMSPRVVVTVDQRDLVVFDGTTGRIASTQKEAFAGHENCFPIRGGTPAFVGCNENGAMTLFRIDAPDAKPVRERAIKGVYTHDFGRPTGVAPLVLAKRCDGSNLLGAFCVRRDEQTWTELLPPPDPQKMLASISSIVHVIASGDGAPYAFGWENGNGDLVIIDGRARTVGRAAKQALPKWAADGLRWDAVTASNGAIRFLIHTAPSGVLQVRTDGRSEAEPLSGRLSGIGDRGLLVTPEGTVRETLDAGRTLHDVPPPPGGAAADRVFCVEAGCTVGPWHRLGWGP